MEYPGQGGWVIAVSRGPGSLLVGKHAWPKCRVVADTISGLTLTILVIDP